VDYQSLISSRTPIRNIKDMRGKQLFATVRHVETYFPDMSPRRQEEARMKALVEIHKRIGLSMGCLSFVLLGIPLGMTNKRSSSNKGIPIGLGMVIVFYAFLIAIDSLRNFPWLFPDYLIWIPVIGWQLSGLWMIRKIP
jgi:lipopolysaccharide export LptBFGC system permease protein LptF